MSGMEGAGRSVSLILCEV